MKRIFALVLTLMLCGAFAASALAVIEFIDAIEVPDDLDDCEAEIYRRGYADGYYEAQQGTLDERHPENEAGYYVVNTKSGKFHYPSCNGVQSMNNANRYEFYGTREEAIAEGWKPCGICDP